MGKVIEQKFSYDVELAFVLDGKEDIINDSSVSNIIINYDYETTHMPLMIIKCNIRTSVYNKMLNNSQKGKIRITISKFVDGSKSPQKYINKQLSYFMPQTTSKSDDSTNGKSTDVGDNNTTAYVDCSFGLLEAKCVNMNKVLINELYKNSNTISIINNYTQNFDMIIEPFDNVDTMPLLYITPVKGISELLEYLDTCKSFYSTPYRFFMDYKYTYLLSMKGTAIDIKDNTFKTIKITIADSESNKNYNSYLKGMGTDKDQKIYLMQIDSNTVDISKNETTDKLFNKVYAVNMHGTTKTISINTNTASDMKSAKMKIIRVQDSNYGIAKEYKSASETTGRVINLSLAEVDNSILVPYKEFILNFENKADKEYNGKYILCTKKEVYSPNGTDNNDATEFKCITNLTFKKVMS